MLIDKCNGTCSWCVDKNGYHPINPKQFDKIVLYYNTVLYKGWQSKNGGGIMDSKILKQLLKKVADGKMTTKEAQEAIEKAQREAVEAENGGCCY